MDTFTYVYGNPFQPNPAIKLSLTISTACTPLGLLSNPFVPTGLRHEKPAMVRGKEVQKAPWLLRCNWLSLSDSCVVCIGASQSVHPQAAQSSDLCACRTGHSDEGHVLVVIQPWFPLLESKGRMGDDISVLCGVSLWLAVYLSWRGGGGGHFSFFLSFFCLFVRSFIRLFVFVSLFVRFCLFVVVFLLVGWHQHFR